MTDDVAVLHVKLSPGASSNSISGWQPDLLGDKILKCSVTAIPEKGKANAALIKLLSKTLKIPKSAIEIQRGDTSRTKLIHIHGLSQKDLDALLKN